MKRSNTFAVRPLSNQDEQLLRELLDASAALWNEVNYERLIRYDGEDGLEDEGVWDAPTCELEGLAVVLPQEGVVPRPVEWGDRSRLEILVGTELKDRYDHTGRLRLEITGEPNWPDYDKQGRLNLWYDDVAGTFRASQPVTVSDDARASPLASEEAALDIGANTLVACTTSTGEQYLYEGRELFERFRETTREIARLQAKLKDGRYSSRRIRRLYRRRTRRRDHAQAALCRDLLERLHAEGVETVYVGALTDVLETHWSVETNAKTHNFWAFREFLERLTCTAEEFGIEVAVRSEAWTSQECPQCGSTDRTTRHRETLTCPCGFEGHADLVASRTFLARQTDEAVRPMARPVRFEWDDHEWSEAPSSHRPKERRTDPSTIYPDGNVASGDS